MFRVVWISIVMTVLVIMSSYHVSPVYALTTAQNAHIVIGQTSSPFAESVATATAFGLNTPRGIAFDSSGNLWVADLGSNRVLEYTSSSLTSNNPNAAHVIGQSSFTASSAAASLSGLSSPQGIAFDSSGNLWVADTSNNRVLEYTSSSLTSNNPNAAHVIGQLDFMSSSAATSQSALNSPIGIAFDSSGNLWVADSSNNRVLEYTSSSLTSNTPNAARLIGQTDFGIADPGTSQNGLNSPQAIAFDSAGNLWVADFTNNRVLEYTSSSLTSNGPNAAHVIGQSDFISTGSAASQSGLSSPQVIAFDSSGNLWVVDNANNRVLEYVSKTGAQSTASPTISNGGASSDQTGTTGAKVTISGSSAGAGIPVTITTEQLTGKFSDTGTITLVNSKFYDVLVTGISDGNAQVCLNDASAGSSTTMQYWTSTVWSQASSIVSTAGVKVCGTIAVSSLGGTNIAVGDTSSSSSSSSSGKGGSTPGAPPSFTTGFAQNQYPFAINENKYKLQNYTNTGPLSTIPVGSPFTIKVTLYGDLGPSSVKHVSLVTNMRGNYASITSADTILSWDAAQPLQIVDPNHFFGPVSANATVVDGKLQVTFHGTFDKPMPLSDIGIRTWGYDLYSQDLYVINSWQATASVQAAGSTVGTPSQILNTTSIITKTSTVNTTSNTNTAASNTNTAASTPASDLVTSVKEWAGYSPTAISDSQLLQSIGYQGTHIPAWVMKSMAKYLVDGTITQDEFAGVVKYLHDNNIIR